jgi:hypothetical protein
MNHKFGVIGSRAGALARRRIRSSAGNSMNMNKTTELEKGVAVFGLVMLILTLLAISCIGARGEVSNRLVQAVREVESPTGKSGDSGRARSHWQLHKAAWTDVNRIRRQHRLKEYSWHSGTKNEFVSKVYARTYLTHLSDRISSHLGRPAQVREIYVAYNWGVTRFRKVGFNFNKAPRVVRGRAQRVENLCR